MEKLLKLINEYEETRWILIDDGLTDEEREQGAYIDEKPTWREYQGHIRHCNANTVLFEKDTFDYYVLSKKYGFVKWLVSHGKLGTDFLEPLLDLNKRYHLGTCETIYMFLASKEKPLEALLGMLKKH